MNVPSNEKITESIQDYDTTSKNEDFPLQRRI